MGQTQANGTSLDAKGLFHAVGCYEVFIFPYTHNFAASFNMLAKIPEKSPSLFERLHAKTHQPPEK